MATCELYHYWERCRGIDRLFFITDDFGNMVISIYSPGMAIYLGDWYPINPSIAQ